MAEMTRNRVKVAADPSLMIDLFTLIHPKNDVDGQVMKALEQGTLSSENWENIDYNNLPKLLRDRSLGRVNNGRYYCLENLYDLLQKVLKGQIEIYITPLTASRLTGLNEIEEEFLNKYIVRVSVRNEDAEEIYKKIHRLANAYKKNERKANTGDWVFDHDYSKACIVAEASYCGLPLITNDLSLVHFNEKRYGMTEVIKNTNRNFEDVNLGVKSKGGKMMTPATMLLSSFVASLRDERYYLYPDNKYLKVNREDNSMMLR